MIADVTKAVADLIRKKRYVVLAVITIVIVLIAMAFYPTEDERKERVGDGSEGDMGGVEVETFEHDGVVTGVAGIGMNDEYEFPVKHGAVHVTVILNGTDVVGVEDLDLEVDGASGGTKTSGSPGSDERVDFDRIDIQKRYGYGTYTARIIAYAAAGTSYHLTVYVYYLNQTG